MALSITSNGAVNSTSQYKFGTGSIKVKSSENFYINNGSDLNFGSNDFTIDFWWNPTSLGFFETMNIFEMSSSNNFAIKLSITMTYPLQYTLSYSTDGTNWTSTSYNDNTFNITNIWTHLAIVRNGSTFKLYRNGTNTINMNIGSNSIYNSNSNFVFFSNYSYYNYVDEIRISKGIARWTSNFTPPSSAYTSDSYTKVLIHGDGTNNSTTITNDINIILNSFTPTDNSITQSLSTNLVMNFDAAPTVSTGNIVIYNQADDTVFQTIAANSGNVSINGTQVTITHNNFINGDLYYILIDSNAFLNFDGISSSNDWNFKIDTFLDSLSPLNGATNVHNNANLVFTALVNMQVGTGNVYIKKYSDDSIIETIPSNDARVTINNKVITINPNTNLTDLTKYYVQIQSGAFQDTSNNNYPGITNKDIWSFTTGDFTLPTIVSTDPVNNATDISISFNLIATWTENIVAVSNKYITIKKYNDDSTVESIEATDSKINISGNQLIINPTFNLVNNTRYYITIEAGAIKDQYDNGNEAITNKDFWSFTTVAENVYRELLEPFKSFSIGSDYNGDILTEYKEGVIREPVYMQYSKTLGNLVNIFNGKLSNMHKGISNLIGITTNKVINSTKAVANYAIITVDSLKQLLRGKILDNNITATTLLDPKNIYKGINNAIDIVTTKSINIFKALINNVIITPLLSLTNVLLKTLTNTLTITSNKLLNVSKLINNSSKIFVSMLRGSTLTKVINNAITINNTILKGFLYFKTLVNNIRLLKGGLGVNITSTTLINTNNEFHREVLQLSSNKILVLYDKAAIPTKIFAKIGNISGDIVTYGNEQELVDVGYPGMFNYTATVINSGKVVLNYEWYNLTALAKSHVILTITNDNISVGSRLSRGTGYESTNLLTFDNKYVEGTEVSLYLHLYDASGSVPTVLQSNFNVTGTGGHLLELCKITTNKFIAIYSKADQKLYAKVVTVGTNSLTAGSEYTLTSDNATGTTIEYTYYYVSSINYADNKVLIAYNNGYNLRIRTITNNNDVLTVSNYLDIDTQAYYKYFNALSYTGNDTFKIYYSYYNSNNFIETVATITEKITTSTLTTDNSVSLIQLIKLDNNRDYLVYEVNNTDTYSRFVTTEVNNFVPLIKQTNKIANAVINTINTLGNRSITKGIINSIAVTGNRINEFTKSILNTINTTANKLTTTTKSILASIQITNTQAFASVFNKIIENSTKITNNIIKSTTKALNNTVNVINNIARDTFKVTNNLINITGNRATDIYRSLQNIITVINNVANNNALNKFIDNTINISNNLYKNTLKNINNGVSIINNTARVFIKILNNIINTTANRITNITKILTNGINLINNIEYIKALLMVLNNNITINSNKILMALKTILNITHTNTIIQFQKVLLKVINNITTLTNSIERAIFKNIDSLIQINNNVIKNITRVLNNNLLILNNISKNTLKGIINPIIITTGLSYLKAIFKVIINNISITAQRGTALVKELINYIVITNTEIKTITKTLLTGVSITTNKLLNIIKNIYTLTVLYNEYNWLYLKVLNNFIDIKNVVNKTFFKILINTVTIATGIFKKIFSMSGKFTERIKSRLKNITIIKSRNNK